MKLFALRRRLVSGNALLVLLTVICFIDCDGLAQNTMGCHVMETREQIPPEKLPPPQKLTGIGNSHIRITATPEAQMWFDQGLKLCCMTSGITNRRVPSNRVSVSIHSAQCVIGGCTRRKSFTTGATHTTRPDVN